MSVIWCKTQYLFEILQTSLNAENSENAVKSRFFEKCSRWRAPVFFEMKEGYKVSYVKIMIYRSIIRRLVFI